MNQINMRIWFLFIVIAVFMVILSMRLLVQSLSTNEKYSRTALGQLNYSSTTKVAMPGDILDVNMSPIAISYRVYTLIIEPKVILDTEKLYEGSLDKTVELIAQTFDLDEQKIRQAINNNPTSNYLRYGDVSSVNEDTGKISYIRTLVSEEDKGRFEAAQSAINNPKKEETGGKAETGTGEAPLQEPEVKKTAAPDGDAAETEENKKKLKIYGVWFEEEARRTYTYGKLASKLVGFRSTDTTAGLWGLENYYNDELLGIDGREFGYLNGDSNLERTVVEPQDGRTLVTTLDMNLTRMISDELEEWFADTDENGEPINRAKAVYILAMDPKTGAIRAYVTDTDYDLNAPTDLTQFYTDEEIELFAENEQEYNEAFALSKETGDVFEWDLNERPTTTSIKNKLWRNSLISDSYEPGSTGKVMTFAAAVEENLIDADTLFQCSGWTQVNGTTIRCHNYIKGGCGTIDALTSIASSCNVAFIDIGLRLDESRFARYQERFNFGQKTGIDLPGEASCEGLLFDEAGLEDDLQLVTSAFGQSYNVTMLQLAAAFCSTINGGYYYKPYIVSQILDSDGAIVKNIEPTVIRQTVSEETSAIVREALRHTITDKVIGTGGGVEVSDGVLLEGYEFIAKTGTAQKLPRKDNKYIISVVSAVPMDDPELVLYVVIDEYEGEADSAPAQYLSGDIWGTICDYIGVYSANDPGPDEYRYADTSQFPDEGWNRSDSMMLDENGLRYDLPNPPADDGSGVFNSILVDPDNVLNPQDVLPQPFSAGE